MSYVISIYNGHVWADEFLIGAIAMMFNVQITVISPFFSDVWNAFHNGCAQPDIVLVCNGVDFGSDRDNITHFSGMRGKGPSWQCVGAGQAHDEIGLYTGHTEGRKTAIDLFTITMNRELLFKTNTMLTDVNQLCLDVKGICIERDQVIKKMEEMKITLGDFKQLTAYYVEEDDVEHQNVMPVQERRIEIIQSFLRSIPKICVKDSRSTKFGKQLVDEALQIMNEDCSTRGEEVCCENEIINSKQKEHYEHEPSSTDKKRLKRSNEGHSSSKGAVKQNKPDVEKEKTLQKLKKRKHCRIKVGAVGKPQKSLLQSLEEYQQSVAPKQSMQEMPIVHNSVCTEQVCDANSQHDEGEIRCESAQKIHGEECQDIGSVQKTQVMLFMS